MAERESGESAHRASVIMVALITLLASSTDRERVLDPSLYIKADGEVLFITIVLSAIITAIADPDQYTNNEVQAVLGYNNPCIVWDRPPALYPAAVLFAFGFYCVMRYAITDSQRAKIDDESSACGRNVTLVANALYALSRASLGLIFVITPDKDVVAHSLIFLWYIPCRWFAVYANWIEARAANRSVTRAQWAYIIVYSLSSLNSFVAGHIMVLGFDGTPVLPRAYAMTSDYVWFVCLPLTSKFMPEAPYLLVQTTLVQPADKPRAGVLRRLLDRCCPSRGGAPVHDVAQSA